MEHTEYLNKLMCPAFLVKDGVITQANPSALQCGIALGTSIADYMEFGKEEYESFAGGRLCLTLHIMQTPYNACVTQSEQFHLICLESPYEAPELRAFALAAQQLRAPLSNAMASAELLKDSLPTDEKSVMQFAQINQSLHQLLRAVSNMSDAALYKAQQLQKTETRDVTALFAEILEKAAQLAEKADRKLDWKVPGTAISCAVDTQKLERAILNLLSNALRHSPSDSTVCAQLKRVNNRLYFSVENQRNTFLSADPFTRYLRAPGLEPGPSGVGLGMSIVHSIAAAHGGTVLMEFPTEDTVRFTLAMAIRTAKPGKLRSPILLPVDYAGGNDRTLLELSDALPCSVYMDL